MKYEPNLHLALAVVDSRVYRDPRLLADAQLGIPLAAWAGEVAEIVVGLDHTPGWWAR